MKIFKILTLCLALFLSPMSFSQSAGGSAAAGSAGSLSSGVLFLLSLP